jgi:hypothetical protein
MEVSNETLEGFASLYRSLSIEVFPAVTGEQGMEMTRQAMIR